MKPRNAGLAVVLLLTVAAYAKPDTATPEDGAVLRAVLEKCYPDRRVPIQVLDTTEAPAASLRSVYLGENVTLVTSDTTRNRKSGTAHEEPFRQ